MRRWVNHKAGLSVEISDCIWDEICILAGSAYPNEFGGILIGSYDETLTKATIEKVFCSPKNAGSRYLLTIESQEGTKFLKKIWRMFAGNRYFVAR